MLEEIRKEPVVEKIPIACFPRFDMLLGAIKFLRLLCLVAWWCAGYGCLPTCGSTILFAVQSAILLLFVATNILTVSFLYEFGASTSVSAASGASTSRASASGASAIREHVGALNMDDDPLVDVVVVVDDDDDDDDGNSRAHKIHDEVRPKKKKQRLCIAHDSRILSEAIRNQNAPFPLPPPDKYYLCDAAYAHTRGFMAPYRNVRYWLGDFRRRRPLNSKEKFNHSHAKLRNVIERAYGVLKARFPILKRMAPFSLTTQRNITIACFALHNFIRKEGLDDGCYF
ncbi:Myb/SANT-like domain, harbinger transposase-derived nuclease domain protein [Tanacetum coccineum]|uniref:Myb/SANT-like domain, harbinger transposase-derived nuclease domain protein n=1 Tax=Tanacetum coccineum TaxID=301880 RepID=A0ABQ5IQ42_9ASTR